MATVAKHEVKFAFYKGEDPYALRDGNPSLRFTTTMKSGMLEVAERLSEVPNREEMAAELHARKVNNTKTNIEFGSDATLWETDSMSTQKFYTGGDLRGPDVERNKALKQSLTRTNFSLFNGEPEPPNYTCVSKLEDPTGRIHEYTGQLQTQVKAMIKQSSLSFGTDDPIYKSVNQEGMELVDKSLKPGELRGPDVARNKELKLALSRSRLNFGEEKTDYTSCYVRGFAAPDKNKIQVAALAKEVKNDLRKTHFTFGDEETVWETDSQRSQREVAQRGRITPAELAKQIEHNKQLKIDLQRTNINLGCEEEYM